MAFKAKVVEVASPRLKLLYLEAIQSKSGRGKEGPHRCHSPHHPTQPRNMSYMPSRETTLLSLTPIRVCRTTCSKEV